MTRDIYAQHNNAFANVSAYVVLKDGQRVATVAFKFGTAVTAYVHWIGIQMQKGRAGGGGYDRQSAAVEDAVDKTIKAVTPAPDDVNLSRTTFFRSLRDTEGSGWIRTLEQNGFTVIQAV